MCNGWNHADGCACGFGPPYDRNVPQYFDEHIGDEACRDLSSSGPECTRLASQVGNRERATQLISSFLWQSFMGQRESRSTGRRAVNKIIGDAVVYVVRHGKGY